MQLNTILKVGGLAFSVAQDDSVRELFTMVHKGAKRRGFYGPPVNPPQSKATSTASAPTKVAEHPVPFTPQEKSGPSSSSQQAIPNLNQLLTGANAKKLLGVAGQIGQMLIK